MFYGARRDAIPAARTRSRPVGANYLMAHAYMLDASVRREFGGDFEKAIHTCMAGSS